MHATSKNGQPQEVSIVLAPNKLEIFRALCVRALIILLIFIISSTTFNLESEIYAEASRIKFPGVSDDVSAFCDAQSSLEIELATMVVHVKRNSSFNYKLYLFSGDHVFQTGQVVPRDDFRVHSFPVKLKRLSDFWPKTIPAYRYSGTGLQVPLVPNEKAFSLDRFLSPVPLYPNRIHASQKDDSFSLPGDHENTHLDHDVGASAADDAESPSNPNSTIDFDRDDQLSVARLPSYLASNAKHSSNNFTDLHPILSAQNRNASVVPVGSFSSFYVNQTYLVRKDFDQVGAELIKIMVDSHEFKVKELIFIDDYMNQRPHPDYEFLGHKLLRDPDIRVTSINQIYEDWITKNLYTIVYVQRRIHMNPDSPNQEPYIITDRLVFRGTSISLIAADQLDYDVKAAAFITEKNGLHYYLEFLANSAKFYLCAVDWSKRPFRVIDSRQLPIKATKTLFDNEELLLCPPSPCYSDQPLDEVVDYGRLSQNTSGSLNSRLDTKLHLRDWNWSLEAPSFRPKYISGDKVGEIGHFRWVYEQARRNEIKAKQDNYGYPLIGHEIDASYRTDNVLYLISANHLITINYTEPNEIVTSSHLISDEFQGLQSTLLDPITGAFYDDTSNKLYFFKGDRFVGFDFATKQALEEYQMQPAIYTDSSKHLNEQHLISSLPVIGILGRQHWVDGVYHDLMSGLVYIFTGMKFYTFKKSDFRNGSFYASRSQDLPTMLCINEHFLDGCSFTYKDENPCKSDSTQIERVSLAKQPRKSVKSPARLLKQPSTVNPPAIGPLARLIENTFLRGPGKTATQPLVEVADRGLSSPQASEQSILVYLILSTLMLIFLIVILMIALLVKQIGRITNQPACGIKPFSVDDLNQIQELDLTSLNDIYKAKLSSTRPSLQIGKLAIFNEDMQAQKNSASPINVNLTKASRQAEHLEDISVV